MDRDMQGVLTCNDPKHYDYESETSMFKSQAKKFEGQAYPFVEKF